MRWFLTALCAALPVAARAADPAALAARIDARIDARLEEVGATPAPRADDYAFLRRTSLLLAGRIPLSSEVHAFLADADPAKRRKLVDRLLASPGYANHFTAVWRGWLLPESKNSEIDVAAIGFEGWLRPLVKNNQPYDKFVTELLTYDVSTSNGRPAYATELYGFNSPKAFYVFKEAKPENLAAATARQFLGIQLECAQCHDHPFAKWGRDQFWELAAFFAGIERQNADNLLQLREIFDRRELLIPNTDRVVSLAFLDESEPEIKPRTSSRKTLTAWMTKPDNAYFARALVNRMWGYTYGVGLVDPVDDIHAGNPPSHPELLDELARAFVDSGFDVQFLFRAMMASEAFQRSSAASAGQDARLFGHYAVQGLSPEQLRNSLMQVAADPEREDRNVFNPNSDRRQFLDVFALSGKRTASETSILQALTLMNGNLVQQAANPYTSRLVTAAVGLPGLTEAERLDVLYVAALGRPAAPDERARAQRHVRPTAIERVKAYLDETETDPRKGYGDVLWALLNSAEFRTNH